VKKTKGTSILGNIGSSLTKKHCTNSWWSYSRNVLLKNQPETNQVLPDDTTGMQIADLKKICKHTRSKNKAWQQD
jgi:hypothetical protein